MKKRYRLKKWAQTLYSIIGALAFCLLVGVSAIDFTFGSIVFIAVVMIVFGFCGYMLNTYGREE